MAIPTLDELKTLDYALGGELPFCEGPAKSDVYGDLMTLDYAFGGELPYCTNFGSGTATINSNILKIAGVAQASILKVAGIANASMGFCAGVDNIV